MPDSFDISQNINLLKNGTNVLAVEIHNVSGTSTDLTAVPFLSLGQTTVQNCRKSKLLGLSTSTLHTNFKISSSGEPLILSSPDSVIVDSLGSVIISVNVSYGIVPGSAEKKYFIEPTPGLPNGSIGYYLLEDDSVKFNKKSQFITSSIALQLSSSANLPIYYTKDNSEPTRMSNLFNGDIPINSTSTIRARVFEQGKLPGKIYSVSFLKERKPDLPVISLTTEDDYLWDHNIGMYELGPNAGNRNPYFGANFWMDWEYPFSFAFFDEEGNCQISREIGAKIFGAWSRAKAQKSFSLFARKEYGRDKIEYPLFKNHKLSSFSSVVLRNSGNDWARTMMADGLMTGITAHLNLDHQAFQPTVTYLNGTYWGIYNMREKINEDFLADHHQLDPDEIIILENVHTLGSMSVIEGNPAEYEQLTAYLTANSSLQPTDNYNWVSAEIEIDNYIKYQLVQIYVGNTDWPGNNNKYWKTTDTNSKWRWVLYDTDFGFKTATGNTLEFALSANGPKSQNQPWSTLLFRRMMSNREFRNNFINQMADNINTTFTPVVVNPFVDSLAALIKNEMPYHCTKWGHSFSNWQNKVASLKTFAAQRPNNVRGHVQNYFSLPSQQTISLDVSNRETGSIKLNSILPENYPFSGIYFEGVPITVTAVPKVGYSFVKWEGDYYSSDLSLTINLEKRTSLKAVFEKNNNENIALTINEINYKSSEAFDAGDWIEIFNPSTTTLDISGYILSEGSGDAYYLFPSGTILEAGDYLVLARNIARFHTIYPEVKNVKGEFPFGLSANGDQLRLYNGEFNLLDAVGYLTFHPWPENVSETNYTIELKEAAYDNNSGNNWQANSLKGTPGKENTRIGNPLSNQKLKENLAVSIFPTKFSDFVSIKINLLTNSDVTIDIVNLQGQVVHQIREHALPFGEYLVDWTPNADVVNGVYIVRVQCNNTTVNSKVVYLK